VAFSRAEFRVGGRTHASHMKTPHLRLRPSRLFLVATLAIASVAHAQSLPSAYLSNVSVRGNVGAGAQTLIVGFSIGGYGTTGSKNLLIRGLGPYLSTRGVTGALADPSIAVFSGNSQIASNDNWDPTATPVATQNTVTGLVLPAGSRDAALIVSSLSEGPATVQVTGVGGTSGIVLAEVYDLAPASSFTATTPRFTNLSCRAQVDTDANIMVAGIVVSGSGQCRLLIRAVGPGLDQFNVPGTLADPKLEVFSGSSVILANDNWDADDVPLATQASAGAFPIPAGSRDAAVIVSLTRGPYTVHVSGVGNTTGVALVEVYELP
jgi:hypothetical protein